MKQTFYTDGSSSCECEGDDDDDDLENDNKTSHKTILEIRDALNNLRDLIDVCGAALLGHENRDQARIQRHVAHVLYFYVDSIIQDLEKELAEQ